MPDHQISQASPVNVPDADPVRAVIRKVWVAPVLDRLSLSDAMSGGTVPTDAGPSCS